MNFVIKFLIINGVLLAVLAALSGLFTFIKVQLLYSYLKKNRYERWERLTKFSKGITDEDKLRGWAYIGSQIDNDDENIVRLKVSAKAGMRNMGIFFVAFLISMGIIAALIMASRH